MPKAKVFQRFSEFVSLMEEADEVATSHKWFSKHTKHLPLTDNFLRRVEQILAAESNGNEHSEYKHKMSNHMSAIIVDGEMFDEKTVDALVEHWNNASIYLRDPAMRSELFKTVERKRAEESEKRKRAEELKKNIYKMHQVVVAENDSEETLSDSEEETQSTGSSWRCNVQ